MINKNNTKNKTLDVS